MSKRFLSPVRLVNLASDPVSGSEGDVYWNTTSKKQRVYYNGTWHDATGSSGGSSQLEVLAEPPSSPTTATIYFNSEEKTIKIFNGDIWYDVAGPKELLDHVHYTDGYVRDVDYGNYLSLANYIVSMDGGTSTTNYSVAPNDDIIDGGSSV